MHAISFPPFSRLGGDPIRALIAGVFALSLSGCQTMAFQEAGGQAAGLTRAEGFRSSDLGSDTLSQYVSRAKISNTAKQYAADGIKAMEARDYQVASDLFNRACHIEITNSQLHFLNALAYHLRARKGESGLYQLAEQGYEQAIQFDRNNWYAHFYRGMFYLDQRQYDKAQSSLTEAALYAANDPDVLYGLTLASYYNHDLKTAGATLEGLRRLQQNEPDAPRTMRASAIVSAALNQPEDAGKFVDRYRKVGLGPADANLLEQRVDTWHEANLRSDTLLLAQAGRPPAGAFGAPPPGAFGAAPASVFSAPPGVPQGVPPPGAFGAPAGAAGLPGAPRGPADFVEKQMVAVDVVILSTEETVNNTMGLNLLEGLRLQFGNAANGTTAFSRASNQTRDPSAGGTNSDSTILTRLISIPAVTYSLNIANSDTRHSEVLARPTLAALGGQTSQFFSGTEIVGAATAGGLGSAVQVQKEVGVKLAVTPEFLPDDLIKLQVVAERTFLTNPSANVVFDFRLDTTKTMVNATVVMRFGETLILSGLSERDVQRDRNATPGLSEVPILQYLFSRRSTQDVYKSVLILLTPRKSQYLHKSPATAQIERAKLTEEDSAIADFEEKYKDWYKPLKPNISAVFMTLQGNSLIREFRAGDLVMQNWTDDKSHTQRLKSALEFLFY